MQIDTKVPAQVQEILREADKLGLKFKYRPQYDVSLLDVSRRVQVRVDNVAPRENVNSYANQLKAGVVFPPGLITLDGYIVDCNTRTEAYKQAKIPTCPVVELQIRYLDADEEEGSKLKLLAADANQKGAQRLKSKEAKGAVSDGLRLGLNNKRIQELTGVSNGVINRIRRVEAARARLHKIGMAPETIEREDILGVPEMLALNDEPYRRLALLAKDADLNQREVKDIAKGVAKEGSDEKAAVALTRYREQLADRIKTAALTGQAKPNWAAKLRQAIGALVAYDDAAKDCIERNVALCDDHVAKLREAKEFLDKLMAAQIKVCADLKAKAKEIVSDDDEE